MEALTEIGLTSAFDEETIGKYAAISAKIGALHGCCRPEVVEKISELEDLDFLTKQGAMKIASTLSMSDEQFDELQRLEEEARDLLRPKIVHG